MDKEAKTVCECTKLMRDLKGRTLYGLYDVIKEPPPSPLGTFGYELPEKEIVDDAIAAVKEKIDEIVKSCPVAYEPDDATTVKRTMNLLETETTDENYLNVAGDILRSSEMFIGALVDGVAKKTEGFKKIKGPFSPERYTRHRCTSKLNNIESLIEEIKDTVDDINSYMSPPEPLVDKATDLHGEQMAIIDEYLDECKLEAGELGDKIKVFSKETNSHVDTLEKYDEWTEENWEKLTEKQRRDRIDSRDTHLWNIVEAIKNSQKIMGAFIESTWQGECQMLKWKLIR